MLDPFFCHYECKDGRLYYLVSTAHALHQRKCLEALALSPHPHLTHNPNRKCVEALGLWEEMTALGLPQTDQRYKDTKAHLTAI